MAINKCSRMALTNALFMKVLKLLLEIINSFIHDFVKYKKKYIKLMVTNI